MTFWLAELGRLLDAATPVMMVTIVASKGSSPREAGTRMLVHETGFVFTVGGGRLEFEVLAEARERLAGCAGACVRQYSLGPDLGQCCGGSATMVFEPFSPADAAWVARMSAACKTGPVARSVSIAGDGSFSRDYMSAEDVDGELAATVEKARATERGVYAEVDDAGCRFVEVLRDARQPLWLFGAGHVGRAIVRALAPLPFAVTWIDSRDDGFPHDVPDGVNVLRSPMPQYLADEAPEGTMFLVMTHSHAADEDVCEAVLRRGEFAYLGLIGSKTKSARIRSRLKAKGIAVDLVARVISPIGLAGLGGKEPPVIAASVAADLLLRRIALLDRTNPQESGRHVDV